MREKRAPREMIRTVVSDLGNVLLHFDHMRSCRRLSQRCGRSAEEIYDSMFGSSLVEAYDLGRISSGKFARLCMERLDTRLEVSEVRQIWSDIFDPVEGMEKLIRSLKETYTLVLLSNTNAWHFEHCFQQYPVTRLFDRYALSYRLGFQKPDPRIYRAALAMAGSPPEEALYFDDIPEYVRAAAALGMRALHFENRSQLLREMKAEGI
jgi:putative hydrolase of the HAD superfamily